MSRQYTHVQGLLPSVIAMKEKGYTYRQIADQFGMEKEQIEELCSRERRKQRSELDQIIIEYDVFFKNHQVSFRRMSRSSAGVYGESISHSSALMRRMPS